jgi:hypothetical protein
LDQLLLAGLDPDPARRPQSGAAMARELELCLQPRAHDLLRPTAGGWRSFVRRHGFLVVLLAAVAPNALAAVFNLAYNRSEIVDRVPGAEPVFQNVEAVINGVAFPVGVAVLGLLVWPATSAVRRANAGLPPDSGRLTRARRRCVLLGDYAALVSLVLWLIAGVAYPIALCTALGLQSLTFFVHFMVSLALCGLIAAVYPFFAVTFFAVRVLFPALIQSQPFGAKELAGLEQLKRRTGLYLLLSAVAPMLTVAAWAAMGSENRMALSVLAAVGLGGLGAIFLLSRAILSDLEALTWTVGPKSPGQEGGSSVRGARG